MNGVILRTGPDGSGGGAGGGDPVDSGGGAAGDPSGDGSGTGVLAAVTRGVTGNLPLTGLPVWVVFLGGLLLAGIGKALYRRRDAEVADLIAR